jgi:hypothetical protein
MARSVIERYAVGALAFMAAATWLGVGVTHGLFCLVVAFGASQAVVVYQRRNRSRARTTATRDRERTRRRPPVEDRSTRSELYDGEYVEWRAAGDAAW